MHQLCKSLYEKNINNQAKKKNLGKLVYTVKPELNITISALVENMSAQHR